MRIGLMIYGDLDTLSGGYLYDRYLVRELLNHRHKVEIVSLPAGSYTRKLAGNFSFPIYRNLIRAPYDILLQDELCHPSLCLLNQKILSRASYPVVSIIHHLLCGEPRTRLFNRFFRMIEKKYLCSVQAFIFNSHTTRKMVEDLIETKPHCVVAYPGGDRLGFCAAISEIKSKIQAKGPLNLLFVGNVIPRKGLYQTLQTLSLISPDIWTLTVIGSLDSDPSYTLKVKRLIRKKNLSSQVTLLGRVQDYKLAETISQNHIIFMPFSFEGFGIVFMEAMAQGLPVIASNSGASREIIADGVNGFLVNPEDPAICGKIVECLYRNRDLLWEMSRSAIKCFDSYPNWKESMKTAVEFLHNLKGRSTGD